MSLTKGRGFHLTLWLMALGALGLAALAPRLAGAQASAEPEPMDAGAYGRVQRLRSAVALESRDLAALGLDQARAEEALSGLRSWTESNLARLDQADEAVFQRERALREALRKINVGPRDESAIRQAPQLETALRLVEAQREQLWLEGAAQATRSFSGSQFAAWEAARAAGKLGVPGFHRYIPNLRTQEAEALRQALHDRARGLPARGAAPPLLRHAAAEQARSNANAKLPGVVLAEEKVLPVPPELREPAADGSLPVEPTR